MQSGRASYDMPIGVRLSDDDSDASILRAVYRIDSDDSDAELPPLEDPEPAGAAAAPAEAPADAPTAAPEWLRPGPFQLPRGPEDALAVNDDFRQRYISAPADAKGSDAKDADATDADATDADATDADATDADATDADATDADATGLWSADQVAAAAPRAYAFGAPTFAPVGWGAAPPVLQATFAERIAAGGSRLDRILPIAGVVAAGPAVALHYMETSRGTARRGLPYEFFIVGAADRAARWAKVAEIARRICAAWDEPGANHLALDILTVGAAKLSINGFEYRVVLRECPSLGELLHGFDVAAEGVAFDGRTTALTTLAAYAHRFRVNPVSPRYHSATYAARLALWFGAGFALALPGLRPELLRGGATLALPHLTLAATHVRGLLAVGTVAAAPDAEHDDFLAAVAEQILFGGAAFRAMQLHGRGVDDGPAAAWLNVHELATGGEGYVFLKRYFVRRSRLRARARAPEGAVGGAEGAVGGAEGAVGGAEGAAATVGAAAAAAAAPLGHDYARFGAAEPTFADLLPPEIYRATADALADDAVTPAGGVNVNILRAVFRLSEADLRALLGAVFAAVQTRPGQLIDGAQALAPFRAALDARYTARALAPAVSWWLDRGTLGSLARRPRAATDAEWYGAAHARDSAAPAAADPAAVIDALLGHAELAAGGRAVHDGECALCHEPLFRGAPNSLVLGCGHIFHWAGGDCPGFYGWSARGHTSCPTCRAPFGGGDGDRGGPPPAPAPPLVRLHVPWDGSGHPIVD